MTEEMRKEEMEKAELGGVVLKAQIDKVLFWVEKMEEVSKSKPKTLEEREHQLNLICSFEKEVGDLFILGTTSFFRTLGPREGLTMEETVLEAMAAVTKDIFQRLNLLGGGI